MKKDSSVVIKLTNYIEEEKKKFKPMKDIEQKVNKQLVPLFSTFYPSSNQFNLVKKYLDPFKIKIIKASELSKLDTALADILNQSTFDSKKISKKIPSMITLQLANSYLQSVESVGSIFVNYSILLLIGKGIDLHLEPDRKHHYTRHAKTLEDIESPFLPLSVKIDFLCSNGLDFFSTWIDSPLRNKLAHLDFEITQQGELLIGKNRKKVDLPLKSKVFRSYFFCISRIFLKEFDKIQKKEKIEISNNAGVHE